MINRFTPLFLLATFILSHASIEAKEGMWIPTLLQAVEGDMQAMGLHLTAEDIYSINEGSLKDALCISMEAARRR